ncbi:MAG TPA: exodeoxyribonuclease III [Fimbriimonadaceae bacterium]|nr:exodeoxyribonuclease III [Fimbriimonadaceae bacterium]
MKITTYNAASVRARLPLILDWLAVNEPDVLAIQETKVEDDKFPISDFEDLGYQVALHGQKSWNGVCLLSRNPITRVRQGFEDDLMPTDARIISAEINGVEVVNTYVPNGNRVGSDKWAYKMAWLERFARLLRERYRPDSPVIWLGDINIARRPEDVYDSPKLLGGVGHHPDEFSRLDAITDFGVFDTFRKFTPGPGHYTFWDFVIPNGFKRNLGWRIDHIYATQCLFDLCTNCVVDRDARALERPSDHTFVTAEFDF